MSVLACAEPWMSLATTREHLQHARRAQLVSGGGCARYSFGQQRFTV